MLGVRLVCRVEVDVQAWRLRLVINRAPSRSARGGPTEAIDQETPPVTNWLSPKPATRRPTTMMARLWGLRQTHTLCSKS
jgi:hypothetical protein